MHSDSAQSSDLQILQQNKEERTDHTQVINDKTTRLQRRFSLLHNMLYVTDVHQTSWRGSTPANMSKLLLKESIICLVSITPSLRISHIGRQWEIQLLINPSCLLHVAWGGREGLACVWKKLTIMMGLHCSRKEESKPVGDLSPLQLLWDVTHSNGMSLAETQRQSKTDRLSPNKRCGYMNNNALPRLDCLCTTVS